MTNVTSSPSTASYKAGQTVHVTVSFSEAVTVTGTPTLALNTGQTAGYVSGSGAASLTFDYVVQPGDNASPPRVHGHGRARTERRHDRGRRGQQRRSHPRRPGQRAAASTRTRVVTIDTTAPTVSGVTSSTANGSYNAGATVSIQVGFSENVTVTGTPQLALSSGGTADYASGSRQLDTDLHLHGRRRRDTAPTSTTARRPR